MRLVTEEFAHRVPASRPRGRDRLGRATRRGVCAALAVLLAVAATGCSWMGGPPGDPATTLDAADARPEAVAAARAAAWDRMQLAPREPYWPFRVGELYEAEDSTAEAVTYLQRALALDPTYAPAVALLSKVYYDAGMHEDGVALLDGYVTGNPGAPDALRAALALHLEALGDVDRANAVLAECSEDSKDARAARTFVSLRGDGFESSLEVARRALDADPNSAANHNNYGIALLYAGKPLEARKAFLEALELDGSLPGALYNMAIVESFYFFDDDAAREWYAKYRRLASDDPDGLEAHFGADVSARSRKDSGD
jgi:superkiller protein 3